MGIGVTRYRYPLCRKIKPSLTKNRGSNCGVLVSIERRLARLPEDQSNLMTCAYFQVRTLPRPMVPSEGDGKTFRKDRKPQSHSLLFLLSVLRFRLQ